MRLSFFSTSVRFSGGRLMMFRHAEELARRGHEVRLWIQDRNPQVDWMPLAIPVHSFRGVALESLPPADLWIFDRVRLASLLHRVRPGTVVQFCQGFEARDVENRLQRVWSERGIFGLREWWRLRRRLREILTAYRLPTTKIVINRHLERILVERFQQTSHLVPCGLPTEVFFPPEERTAGKGTTVLVVGPTDIPCKRITDALQAIRTLKTRRPQVRLLRVAQHPMREVEKGLNVTDEYHTMIPQTAMAELYRRADVALVCSDATEGFGLPVLEAMACGVSCVLTDIPAFRSFAAPDDYAHFVPVGAVNEMARALERLLDQPQERSRLRQRGLQVAASYTLQRSFDAMESALRAIGSAENRSALLRA